MKTRHAIIGTGVAVALACGSVTPALAAPAHPLASSMGTATPDAVMPQVAQTSTPTIRPGATGTVTFRFSTNGAIGTIYTLTAPTGTIWTSTARSYKTSDGKTGTGNPPTLSADKRVLTFVGTGWGGPAGGWIEDTYQLTSIPGNTSSGLVSDGSLVVIGGAAVAPGVNTPISYTSTYVAPEPARVTLSAPPAGAVITDTKRPALSGKGQPGATVTVTDTSGGKLASAMVAADGTWSAASSRDLFNGGHAGVVSQDVDGSTIAYAFTLNVANNEKPADIIAGPSTSGTATAGSTVEAPISFTNTSGGDLREGKITFTTPAGTRFPSQQSLPLDWRAAGSGGAFTRWADADCAVDSISADGRTLTCAVTLPTTKAGWNNGNEFRWTPKVAIDASTSSGPAVVSARAEFGTASVTNSFRIDVTALSIAPVVLTAPAFGGTTQATQPVFEGTGQPGATIEVKGSTGRFLASARVAENGHWSATSTITLGAGRYVGTVSQTAGAHSSTAAFDFTVVKPTSELKLTSPAIGAKTGEPKPTFTGTGHPGASIVVKGSSGRELATATVTPAGSWQTTSTLELAPGRYIGTVTQNAGGQISQVAFDFAIPRPLVLTSPQLGATIKELTPTFTGTGDPGASIEIRGNSGAVIANATVGADNRWAATSKITLFEGRFIGSVTHDAGGVKTQTAFDFTIKK